ncbi:MAG: PDZ domain-containing protein [Akkermansiaceae bacterium]
MIFLRLSIVLAFVSSALANPGQSVVRVNSTVQTFSASQPWEKTPPRKRRGLGAVLENQTVLTTAKMAADAIYLELQSADSSRNIPAQVIAIDYEANLALLGPANEAGFLSSLTPTMIAEPLKQGDELNIVQLQDKGTTQTTKGVIRSLELLSTFVSGRYFLSYEVKATIQTESNSYTLPAFKENKLAGILTSYDSKEQNCDIISVDIIRSFLEDARDGAYLGFPSLGVGYSSTEDPNFRAWLKLPEDQGGLYLSRIIPGGSAAASNFKKGDVLLSIAGFAIDRKGYYQHPNYGPLFWTHLVRGAHQVGETIPVRILREGNEIELPLTLKRSTERLIPTHLHDQAPPYLIKGGLVFQELSLPYLKAFGKEWSSRAPLNLLDVYYDPENHAKEGRRRVLILTRVIPTDATIGYERVASQIVTSVNGNPVAGLPELAKALAQTPASGLHEINTDGSPYRIYLDQTLADRVDQQFKASGLPSLSRLYPVE